MWRLHPRIPLQCVLIYPAFSSALPASCLALIFTSAAFDTLQLNCHLLHRGRLRVIIYSFQFPSTHSVSYLPLSVFCSARLKLSFSSFVLSSALLCSFTLRSLPSPRRTALPCIRFSCGIWGWGHQSPKDRSEITERELVQKTHIIFLQCRVTHTHTRTHTHTHTHMAGFDRRSWRWFHLGFWEKIAHWYLFCLRVFFKIKFI